MVGIRQGNRQLRDANMRLNKPRIELVRSGALPECGSYELQTPEGGQPSLSYLTRLTAVLKRNRAAFETYAYSEMRRAQADAQQARERALARIQLARQLAR